MFEKEHIEFLGWIWSYMWPVISVIGLLLIIAIVFRPRNTWSDFDDWF